MCLFSIWTISCEAENQRLITMYSIISKVNINLHMTEREGFIVSLHVYTLQSIFTSMKVNILLQSGFNSITIDHSYMTFQNTLPVEKRSEKGRKDFKTLLSYYRKI